MSGLVDQTAASLVRRSRAGDQNATATLYRIGEEARKGAHDEASRSVSRDGLLRLRVR